MPECQSCLASFTDPDSVFCPACWVRLLRRDLAEAREAVALLERRLKLAEVAAGCRPGDGSDQPALFAVSAQGGLFG